MRYLVGQILIGGQIVWQDMSRLGGSYKPPGLQLSFPLSGHISQYDFFQILRDDLVKNDVDWLYYEHSEWKLDSKNLKKFDSGFSSEEWLSGIIIPDVRVEHKKRKFFDREEDQSFCIFRISPEMVADQMPKKVFLSHKGINKPLVRQFALALTGVGLSPWIDEDAMHAGTELERGLLAGFEDSCAAVFFITPDFKDEYYLSSEINYAIAQKRKKNDRFSIITLVFSENNKKGLVPDLLKQYVWKEPNSDLSAFVEIMKALPVKVTEAGWR